MHGIEPQTKESIQLLKRKNTPFVVALNKVDRLYGWITCPNAPIRDALKNQPESVVAEFETRVRKCEADIAGEGINSTLYYRNKDFKHNISLVPTSAISGEGIPDILMLLIQMTQSRMEHRLTSKNDKVECSVLEVKKIPGHGFTIDVVLANGTLRIGDTILLAGLNGEPIITTIKSLLTPPMMKELRVKSQYQKIVKFTRQWV
jgi:translation initiation factor 5B